MRPIVYASTGFDSMMRMEVPLVYEDGRTLVPGEEKKKEDSDAERARAIGAA